MPFSQLPELAAHFPTLAAATGLLAVVAVAWAVQRQLKTK
jgi:hypothetical protein